MEEFKQFWKKLTSNEFRKADKLTGDQLDSVRQDIKKWQDEKYKSSEIIGKLMRKYSDLKEKWKAERVYYTEVKRFESKEIKIDSQDVGYNKFRIIPSPNACPLCIAVSKDGNKIFKGKDLIYKGRGIPPIHPNCYCQLVPVDDD